jgi:lipopolysaccharide transport system permease protein
MSEARAAAPPGQEAGLARARDLMIGLSQSDLRARYGRGPWRLAKWLLDPFALVGVYLLLVTAVLKRGGPAPGLTLACAVIPFQLVMMTVTNALDAIKIRRGIVANMAFPRILLPVTSALTETLAFGASFLLIAIMMAVYGVAPTTAALWLPLVIGVNLAVAIAFAYPATLLGLWVPDLRPFAVSFMRTLFFLAPGLIALEEITGTANSIVQLNPLTGVFEAYRSALIYDTAPTIWQIVNPLAFAAIVGAIFIPIYRSEQRQFAKVIE